MVKLGSIKQPAIVRVQDQHRAVELLSFCKKNDWHVIIGIEPDKQEDISDIEKLINPPKPVVANSKRGRNEPCVCGSGKKYKKCCLESKV